MTITSTHVSGNLRFVDYDEERIHSYNQIRPTVSRSSVEGFLAGVLMLRGEVDGNAYLTLTTALEEGV